MQFSHWNLFIFDFFLIIYVFLSATDYGSIFFLSSSEGEGKHPSPEERRAKSSNAIAWHRRLPPCLDRIPSFLSEIPVFPEGSDLKARRSSPRNRRHGVGGGGRKISDADPGELRGNSSRVACHANIWHLRDRAFSINFRPIFNFNQDALLCETARRRQSRRSQCLRPSPPSLGIRKHLGVVNSGGSCSAARSLRWMLATVLTRCCCHLYSVTTPVHGVSFHPPSSLCDLEWTPTRQKCRDVNGLRIIRSFKSLGETGLRDGEKLTKSYSTISSKRILL